MGFWEVKSTTDRVKSVILVDLSVSLEISASYLVLILAFKYFSERLI